LLRSGVSPLPLLRKKNKKTPASNDDRGIEASGQQNCAQIVPVKVKFNQMNLS